ncbi:scarecrow-like protein 15 [Andrographis paniculata]|uniref:scarecrow-like protein 15 n=1 Tax=Andrographis paniculata TaxID=175694 RepID=UPI0021E9438A|nr:scarecrow-like protein 15 [Andrographis paniculata]
MKVPLPSANNPHDDAAAKHAALSCTAAYEPSSVLDLRGSPSPVAEKTAADNLEVNDHALINHQPAAQLEDWDSLMRELGLHDIDDESPVSRPPPFPHPHPHPHPEITDHLPEFPPLISSSFDANNQLAVADFGLLTDIANNNNNNNNSNNPNSMMGLFEGFSGDVVGLDFVDELIRLAECFETGSFQLAHVISARLNQRLSSPAGKPLQRAAFYFKEALQSLLTGSPRPPANSMEIVQTIKAQRTFSNISPIFMFSSFTANQALLDAALDSPVHVIDFDIGLGGHWASFMKELADRSSDHAPPLLRISAIVPEEYAAESRLVRENSTQFARELNIRFEIQFISIRSFEYLSFKAIKFMEGEKVAVLSSPAIFRQIGTGFLNDLRRISPHVVVHVDMEGQMGLGTTPYRQAVIDGLEFYSTLLESLEAANFNGGGDWMRRIETFVLYPKIVEAVEAAGRRAAAWREALLAAGLRQVGLSQFADIQADCLLRRLQVRGFHVAKRQGEMLLCWHDRPLVATSAWRY